MKEAQTTVYDKQIYPTHSDEAENKFSGNITFKNESVYITYKDEEQNITTVIKAKDNRVSVKRLGAIRGNLEFDSNKPHRTIYSTPYGDMDMEIVTQKCEVYFLTKGVKIHIEYKIMMQGEKVSDNIYLVVAN